MKVKMMELEKAVIDSKTAPIGSTRKKVADKIMQDVKTWLLNGMKVSKTYFPNLAEFQESLVDDTHFIRKL